jgi:hypothetical protein
MLATRGSRSKASWEKAFSFPQVSPGYAHEPLVMWRDMAWHLIGEGDVGLFRSCAEVPKDPISSLLKTEKEVRMYTKGGHSCKLPDERVKMRNVGGESFFVVDVPSVFEVWLGVAEFRILACFGYCMESKEVILFNVKNCRSDVYRCDVVDAKITLGKMDHFEFEQQTSPSYSSNMAGPKLPITPIEKISSELKDVLKTRPYLPADEEFFVQKVEVDVIERVRASLERETELRHNLMKLIDPTHEEEVEIISVVDRQIKKDRKRRSVVEKQAKLDPTIEAANKALRETVEKVRKEMGITDDGVIPFPTAPPEEKKENEAKQMATPVLQAVNSKKKKSTMIVTQPELDSSEADEALL